MSFMDHMTTSAGDWLSLPDSKAQEVFPGPVSSMKSVYRRLVQNWHPDRNADPQAQQVLVRIQQLYRLARLRRRPTSTDFHIQDHSGRKFRYRGRFSRSFELGKVLFANATFAYAIDPAHKVLFDRFSQRVSGLSYANGEMEKSFSHLLPRLHSRHWGPQGGLLLLSRPPGFVSLHDLMEYHHRHTATLALPAVHVAWIINGVLNLVCFLQYQGLTHNAISRHSVWVNPQTHEVALLGGWFYSQPKDHTIDFLPASSVAQASTRFLSRKIACPGFDLDLTRALGRDMLGDGPGTRLASAGHSTQMVDFLLGTSSDSALEQYRAWKQVLLATFGPPQFVPMNITSEDIYKEIDNG